MRTSKVFPILSILILLLFIALPVSARKMPRVWYADPVGPPLDAQHGPYVSPAIDIGDGPFPEAIPKGALDIGDEVDGRHMIPREELFPKWRMFFYRQKAKIMKQTSPLAKSWTTKKIR